MPTFGCDVHASRGVCLPAESASVPLQSQRVPVAHSIVAVGGNRAGFRRINLLFFRSGDPS
jgi:hypothetical protein